MADIMGRMPTAVPKSDARIERIDFEQNEQGARKNFLPKPPKNNMGIKHVAEGR